MVVIKVTYKLGKEIESDINDVTYPNRGIGVGSPGEDPNGSTNRIPDTTSLSEQTKAKIKFQAGDNIMEVDRSNPNSIAPGSGGTSTQGGSGAIIGVLGFANGASIRALANTIFHEAFHLLGYDERYSTNNSLNAANPNPGFMQDYMGGADGYEFHNLHYVDLIKYVIGNAISGQKAITDGSLKVDNTSSGNNPATKEERDNADKSRTK